MRTTFAIIVLSSMAFAEEMPRTLFDFSSPDAAKNWQNVNDNVMGGVSEGKFRITDQKTMEFFGKLSLANNGGFASVRTKSKKLGLKKGEVLVARVRGDGREYQMNLYVPTIQIAYSYRSVFQTKKDEWIEVELPLEKFEATSFGQVVKNAGPVDPASVNGIGFLLNDKKAGPFKMEVEWIKVVSGEGK
jgi:NADH dehydrogenase [ubiquinone] 1 alpha subcomplex assembly factor 1